MTVLTKLKEESSFKHGKSPENRTISELLEKGFIVIDKDAGPTSHESTDNVKKILCIERAGHSGTLDPKVTGVLVVGLNKATRLMEYMLKSNKEYVCLVYVHKEIEEKKIKEVLKKFTGEITQLPPVISAVKRSPRKRTIYSIDLLDIEGKNVLFRVSCQHGTYIRKLCSDIGEDLGCNAHMKELKRTKAGPFTENCNMISLDKLRNLYNLYNKSKNKEKDTFEKELRTYIKPMEDILKDFKKVYVRDSSVDTLCHGADLAIPGISKLDDGIDVGEEIAIMTIKGELIAMGMSFMTSKEIMKKKKRGSC